MNAILGTIILCGLMGLVGQGIRAAVGLKSEATLQAQNPNQQSVFDAAYFALTLGIGFIAGVMAGFVIGLDQVADITPKDPKLLFAIMAAGYAGTDFIENAFTNLMPKLNAPATSTAGDQNNGASTVTTGNKTTPTTVSGVGGDAASSSTAEGKPAAQAAATVNNSSEQALISAAQASTLDQVSRQVSEIHAVLAPQPMASSGGILGYPAWALTRDATAARSKYWQFITDGATAHQLPVAVVMGIGSKESHWGFALKPQGPAGTGDFTPRNPAKWGVAMPTDGLGWGRGLMQIDWYSNDFAKTGNWQDAEANILYGCELLAEKIKKFSDAGVDPHTALLCGVSAYNGMSGPNSSYSTDVMARANWFTKQGLDTMAAQAAAA
jgi:hypothetical protein